MDTSESVLETLVEYAQDQDMDSIDQKKKTNEN